MHAGCRMQVRVCKTGCVAAVVMALVGCCRRLHSGGELTSGVGECWTCLLGGMEVVLHTDGSRNTDRHGTGGEMGKVN